METKKKFLLEKSGRCHVNQSIQWTKESFEETNWANWKAEKENMMLQNPENFSYKILKSLKCAEKFIWAFISNFPHQLPGKVKISKENENISLCSASKA